MADDRERSPRAPRRRNTRSLRPDLHSSSSRRGRSNASAASRRPRSSSKSPRRSSAQSASSSPSQKQAQVRSQRDAVNPTGRPGGGAAVDANAGSIVLRSSSSLARSNGSVRGRDGRRMNIAPDPRRRAQVGAYAPAFGGRRSRSVGATPRRPITSSPLAPTSSPQSAFPGAQAAGTYRPVQKLSPRPIYKHRPPEPRKPRRKPVRRRVSPWIHGIRLLILGIGMSAIAGTVLSVLNPSRQELAANDSDGQPAAGGASQLNALVAAPESGRSLMSSLQPGQEMSSLSQDIQDITEAYPDLNPGVFVYDLDTGNYVNVNGTTPFSAASTIKIPILIAFFQDVESGALNPDEILIMEEEDVASGSGNMQLQAVGTEFTALEVASEMIITSDNTATNMLIRRLGGMERLNERFRAWGLRHTALRNLLPDLEGTNSTSPKELAELMALISREELLSGRSRDRLLHIMRRTQTNTLLPQGLSSDATIFHKTGDIGTMLGDAGLVDVPNGKRYAIAVQVQRPHNDTRAHEIIRRVSSQVYSVMEDASLNPSQSPARGGSDSSDTDRLNSEDDSGAASPNFEAD